MTFDLNLARQIKLHRSAQALLYDISRRVRHGYHWWLTGEIAAEKILPVAAKLSYQYDTTVSTVTRSRRKSAGGTSVILMVWPLRHDPAGYTTRYSFLLLATEHLDGEVMYDGRRKPARVNLYADGHVVYHLMPKQVTVERKVGRFNSRSKPKRGEEKSAPQSQVRSEVQWSFDWQLSAKSYDLMRQRFAASVHDPAALSRLRQGYATLPMTRGYRQQLRTVLTETKAMWKTTSTPRVVEAKAAIKEGRLADPFAISTLPYIRGFPTLYDSPPMTLGRYLDASRQVSRERKRQDWNTVSADHPHDIEPVSIADTHGGFQP